MYGTLLNGISNACLSRNSGGRRTKKTISYREINEDEDISDSERVLLDEERSKGFLKEIYGVWTVRLDLSQSWERDAGARQSLTVENLALIHTISRQIHFQCLKG